MYGDCVVVYFIDGSTLKEFFTNHDEKEAYFKAMSNVIKPIKILKNEV
jgi:hypothetical protein